MVKLANGSDPWLVDEMFSGLYSYWPSRAASIVGGLDLRNYGLFEKCKTEIAPRSIEISLPLIANRLAIADHVNDS